MAALPLVSVILPAYNAAPFLREAALSILCQTHTELELLVIDDGSTDATAEIAHDLSARDARVRVVSRENRGLIQTLNEGLDLARGDLIARMDADDIAHPERLARQAAVFAKNPGLGVCGTGYYVAKRGRVLVRKGEPIFETADLATLSLFFTVFIHPTVMFNRKILGDDLKYDPSYPHAEDFDLFRRIAQNHSCHFIKDSLLIYRMHGQSVTSRHRGEMRSTHLRIVSENLRSRHFSGDLDALDDLACLPNENNLLRAGRLCLDLSRQIADRETHLQPTYHAGRLNLFYFLYDLLAELDVPAWTSGFLDSAQGWGLIRRSERLALRSSAFLPSGARHTRNAGLFLNELLFDLRARPTSKFVQGAQPWTQ